MPPPVILTALESKDQTASFRFPATPGNIRERLGKAFDKNNDLRLKGKAAVSKFGQIVSRTDETSSFSTVYSILNPNGDSIEYDGFDKALQASGLFMTKDETQTLFMMVDVDRNGSVDCHEFIHFGLAV